jgi:hypothetical protein
MGRAGHGGCRSNARPEWYHPWGSPSKKKRGGGWYHPNGVHEWVLTSYSGPLRLTLLGRLVVGGLLHISILERGTTPGAHRLRRNEVWGGTTLAHAKIVASVTSYGTFPNTRTWARLPAGQGSRGKNGFSCHPVCPQSHASICLDTARCRVGGTAPAKLQCAARAVVS